MKIRKVRQAIFFASFLGIAGLMVAIPELAMGQANPPATTTQSGELAEAEKLNQQVIQFIQQGKYREAIPLAEYVLEMTKRLLGDNHLQVATTLNNLASLYSSQGRYTEAEPLYIQALEMTKRLLGDNHPIVARSLDNLASLYTDQGRYKEAEPLYIQALEMTKRLLGDNHPDVATTLNNLASLYTDQRRYKEAEPLYIQALEMTKRLLGDNHPDVADSLNILAFLYENQGRYTEAEPLYIQALEMRKRLLGDNHPNVAQSLNNLAFLYSSQGRYKEAEPLYIQALEMTKRLLGDNHPNVARSLNNLAGLYSSQGRYKEAEPLYIQALEMTKRLLGDNHPNVAQSLNNLAFLYLRQDETINALELLTQGVATEEYNLNYNLAAGFERQKRDYIKTISGTTDATISLHLNSEPNNFKAARLAFTTISQRKGRILDILTNNLQILRQRVNEPESLKLIDELSNLYSQLAVLIHKQPEKLSPDEYRQQITNLEEQVQRKEDELSRRSAEFRLQSQPVNLAAIQKLIPSDAVLVELVRYKPLNPKAQRDDRFGEPRYAAYILKSSGEPQGIDLGAAEEIEKVLERFRQDVQDPQTPNTQVKQSARELDQIVMQPIRKLLGNTRKILIAPDGALNLIPFEALVDENDEYLLENYALTYLTSGRDLLRLQNTFPSKQPPVIMADPYFDKKPEVVSIQNLTRSINLSQQTFPPLPGTAKEAKAISSLLGIQPLVGSQASKGNLQQLNSPKILHVATHGFFATPKQEDKSTFEDNPLLLSGLVLAGFKNRQINKNENENGILTALETTSLNLLGTKLVVLSACDTGVGKDTTGEGIYGLRRALVIAGSESQVISLWKVNDDATKDLMVNYYKEIVANQGRSEALRQTQLKMLRGELGKDYQHPYYWAAFIPSGNWRPMER
ncbi:MAG TPA: tetratricopeptide repeat protein [Nostocaceae cyanobacterium]|nr:tetratricopeptide repeat protein [Nostocaceae cyanobacterium]